MWLAELNGRVSKIIWIRKPTFLLNLETVAWDEDILKFFLFSFFNEFRDFGISKDNLPIVRPSVSDFGTILQGSLKGIKITCVLGDQ